MCGGTRQIAPKRILVYGLSPRVRGNLELRRICVLHDGSIPACAGEPTSPASHCRLAGVYPRVCGGTLMSSVQAENAEGLSPRVRGNLPQFLFGLRPLGSIPACAGEPAAAAALSAVLSVYPRVCGGTFEPSNRMSTMRGLSPRVRGNRLAIRAHLVRWRSIPACAGEPQ